MKNRTLGWRTLLFSLFGLLTLCLLLSDAALATDGVRQGLSLCIETLFPSLFPFLVLSELLVARRAGELLGAVFSRPVSGLFGLSRQGTAPLVLALLCGSPIGTTTSLALYRRGAVSKEELERLILFVNNPSCGFLIGTVGGAMFGNVSAGVALFAITWLSALMVGLFLRLVYGKLPQVPQEETGYTAQGNFVSDLTGSVTRGFSSLLQIFAFVIFFSCVAGCIGKLLTALSLPKDVGVLIHGLLEMTAGIGRAVDILSPETAFRAAAFFAGFAGISICLQIFSILEGSGCRVMPYLLAKLCQGGLALLLCELYLRLFRPALNPCGSMMTFADNSIGQSYIWVVLLLLALLLCFTCIQRRVRPLK